MIMIIPPFPCNRLLELDEGIEALDAAIEYRTDSITNRQLEVRHSQTLLRVSLNVGLPITQILDNSDNWNGYDFVKA